MQVVQRGDSDQIEVRVRMGDGTWLENENDEGGDSDAELEDEARGLEPWATPVPAKTAAYLQNGW